ncbi:hypothetical protein ACQRC6_01230 [Peptoniphilus sp. SGI.035]|uniref:hypothetical protein n=1 Tax=Peptoniphilus sp. SGI.035 TaxID=3420564 RepID=UPI003D06B73A
MKFNNYKEFIDGNLRETKAYTIDGENLYKTEEEAIENYKKERIKSLISSSISNVFDYDQEYVAQRVTEELEKNIEELIEIYNL